MQMRKSEAINEAKGMKKTYSLRPIQPQAQTTLEYFEYPARRVLYPALVPDWELPLDT